MTAQPVLVAYGSKYGATAEIAEWIAEALRERGTDAEVRPAAAAGDLRRYGAVVLGGALYAGRWHRDAARFARSHRRTLAGVPVWLFSSGPLDASAVQREIPATRQVTRLMEAVGAREHRTFGGRLDASTKGFMARRLVVSGKGGDFRDREQISAWAHEIAAELAAVTEGR